VAKTLNEWVLGKLIENSGDTSNISYEDAKSLFGVEIKEESFSRQVRKIRQRNLELITGQHTGETTQATEKSSFIETRNEGELTVNTSQITSIEELVRSCNIDLKVWNIERHLISQYGVACKTDAGIVVQPVFQVKAWLTKKIPDVQEIPVIHPIQLKPNHSYQKGSPATLDSVKKSLVIADAQIGFNRYIPSNKLEPFHDRRAMDCVLKLLEFNTFDEVVVNGDMLDFAEASRFVQKPEFTQTIQPAINELGWYLSRIRELAPNAKITYLIGNHEVRLQKQLIENFKFAYNLKAYKDTVPFYSLRRLLDLDAIDVDLIETYPNGSYWIGSNLRVIHGEFTSIAKELSTSNDSVIFGHLHKMESQSKTVHHKNTVDQIQVVTSGCLCKVDGTVPGVNTRPNWQQGILTVDFYRDKHSINHLPIWDGAVVYHGEVYFGQEYDINFDL